MSNSKIHAFLGEILWYNQDDAKGCVGGMICGDLAFHRSLVYPKRRDILGGEEVMVIVDKQWKSGGSKMLLRRVVLAEGIKEGVGEIKWLNHHYGVLKGDPVTNSAEGDEIFFHVTSFHAEGLSLYNPGLADIFRQGDAFRYKAVSNPFNLRPFGGQCHKWLAGQVTFVYSYSMEQRTWMGVVLRQMRDYLHVYVNGISNVFVPNSLLAHPLTLATTGSPTVPREFITGRRVQIFTSCSNCDEPTVEVTGLKSLEKKNRFFIGGSMESLKFQNQGAKFHDDTSGTKKLKPEPQFAYRSFFGVGVIGVIGDAFCQIWTPDIPDIVGDYELLRNHESSLYQRFRSLQIVRFEACITTARPGRNPCFTKSVAPYTASVDQMDWLSELNLVSATMAGRVGAVGLMESRECGTVWFTLSAYPWNCPGGLDAMLSLEGEIPVIVFRCLYHGVIKGAPYRVICFPSLQQKRLLEWMDNVGLQDVGGIPGPKLRPLVSGNGIEFLVEDSPHDTHSSEETLDKTGLEK